MEPSTPVSALYLAMAAFDGASLMAISAFYIHKGRVDEVVDRLIETHGEWRPISGVISEESSEEEEEKKTELEYEQENRERRVGVEEEEKEEHEKMGASKSLDEKMKMLRSNNEISRSVPNVGLRNEWFGDDAKFDQVVRERAQICSASSVDNLNFIPSGLPPLQTSRRGEGVNCVQQNNDKVVGNQTNSSVDLHDMGKVDLASVCVLENDSASAKTSLALRSASHDMMHVEEEEVRKLVRQCLELWGSYVFREEIAPWAKEPVIEPSTPKVKSNPFHFEPIAKAAHYFRMEDGVIRVYASESDREFLAQKSAPHCDFYNIPKGIHVHHSACMNQKYLLRFIKSNLRKKPDEVVMFRDGKYMTLKEVFDSLDLTGHKLNVDLLDVHADKTTFHQFAKFDLKYNPCGQSRRRESFLKQDNLIQEVTKEVLSDLEASKYQMAEYRVSIYGRKQSEWDQLASWFINNEMYSENAVWLIQLPRLYNVYKQMGIEKSFQNILDNVFILLFEATLDPNSHPKLHAFLMMLCESKGLPTIKLRPHCGEAGDVDHLVAAFLLCNNISHGINLRKSPVLQYLYYLAQIGLAMSPLSNNSLFLDYHCNPFPAFFQRGLNVSLSSDDPLQILLTKESLVEEYSIAAKGLEAQFL